MLGGQVLEDFEGTLACKNAAGDLEGWDARLVEVALGPAAPDFVYGCWSPALDEDGNRELFERMGVLSPSEFESRSNVAHEISASRIRVEARATADIATTMILPAALGYQRQLAETLRGLEKADVKAGAKGIAKTLEGVGAGTDALAEAIETLQRVMIEVDAHEGTEQAHARAMLDKVVPAMNDVREAADCLETVVDDDLWPLPKYRELMFIH